MHANSVPSYKTLLLPPANEVCEGYVFTSVCLSGGWYPSMPGRSPGPHPGGKLRGLAGGSPGQHPGGGGSPSPHPGVGVCIPACTEADTPSPSSGLLLRVVRILLACILVSVLSFLNTVVFYSLFVSVIRVY